VARSLVVSDMLGGDCTGCQRSTRSPGPWDDKAVRIVADQIASVVDQVLQEQALHHAVETTDENPDVW
jgi:hypothetical protein